MTYAEYLISLGACREAVDDAQGKTAQEVWDACRKGNWMLWLIGKTMDKNDEQELRKFILAKARCAKLVVHLMKDERSIKAVEIAEKFGLGQATREELDAAAEAAEAAYAAAYDAYAAAYDAYAAACIAARVAYAANAASAAAAYAAAAYETLEKCAEIVRELYPDSPAKERFV